MKSAPFTRPDGRPVDALRPLRITPGIAPNASGSVLIAMGSTQVICAASLEDNVPRWMKEQKVEGGWMTAEYSMLPYSTLQRKARDISRGKSDGRTIEIQRLIGRALRAVADLSKLPGKTLWIDCDVLQADGGTRTASISGAYVAAEIAVRRAMAAGTVAENPFTDSVGAISVGVCGDTALLDLCYLEDRDASVDANIVMTGGGRFVEIQSAGEEATFSDHDLGTLLALARKGLTELDAAQKAAIESALSSDSYSAP